MMNTNIFQYMYYLLSCVYPRHNSDPYTDSHYSNRLHEECPPRVPCQDAHDQEGARQGIVCRVYSSVYSIVCSMCYILCACVCYMCIVYYC